MACQSAPLSSDFAFSTGRKPTKVACQVNRRRRKYPCRLAALSVLPLLGAGFRLRTVNPKPRRTRTATITDRDSSVSLSPPCNCIAHVPGPELSRSNHLAPASIRPLPMPNCAVVKLKGVRAMWRIKSLLIAAPIVQGSCRAGRPCRLAPWGGGGGGWHGNYGHYQWWRLSESTRRHRSRRSARD